MAGRRTNAESAALKAMIIERYTTTDETMTAVAEALGCDHNYVRRVLINANHKTTGALVRRVGREAPE